MMSEHGLTALVTILAMLVFFWMSLQVARARSKSGIKAPAMTGDPQLERAVRVHYNTLEWLPIFLTGLWQFALIWNERIAAGLGLIRITGRVIYARGYMADRKSAARDRDPVPRERGAAVGRAGEGGLRVGGVMFGRG